MEDSEIVWDVPDYMEQTSSEHPRYPDSHPQSPIRPVMRGFINDRHSSVPKFVRGCLANIPPPSDTLDTHSETT
jgi:hypothetical protein